MATTIAERLLEDPENPVYQLLFYAEEYQLPLRALMVYLGVHYQTILFWSETENDIRAEDDTVVRVRDLLQRLKAAESAGKLVLTGTAQARGKQLIDILGSPDGVEPETT